MRRRKVFSGSRNTPQRGYRCRWPGGEPGGSHVGNGPGTQLLLLTDLRQSCGALTSTNVQRRQTALDAVIEATLSGEVQATGGGRQIRRSTETQHQPGCTIISRRGCVVCPTFSYITWTPTTYQGLRTLGDLHYQIGKKAGRGQLRHSSGLAFVINAAARKAPLTARPIASQENRNLRWNFQLPIERTRILLRSISGRHRYRHDRGAWTEQPGTVRGISTDQQTDPIHDTGRKKRAMVRQINKCLPSRTEDPSIILTCIVNRDYPAVWRKSNGFLPVDIIPALRLWDRSFQPGARPIRSAGPSTAQPWIASGR